MKNIWIGLAAAAGLLAVYFLFIRKQETDTDAPAPQRNSAALNAKIDRLNDPDNPVQNATTLADKFKTRFGV